MIIIIKIAHRVSVALSVSRGAQWQGLQEAVVNVSGLVLLEHAVGTQLGHPDVEELVALYLGERKRRHEAGESSLNRKEKLGGHFYSLLDSDRPEPKVPKINILKQRMWNGSLKVQMWNEVVPSCGKEYLQHPSRSDLTSCLWTSLQGWHLTSPGPFPLRSVESVFSIINNMSQSKIGHGALPHEDSTLTSCWVLEYRRMPPSNTKYLWNQNQIDV